MYVSVYVPKYLFIYLSIHLLIYACHTNSPQASCRDLRQETCTRNQSISGRDEEKADKGEAGGRRESLVGRNYHRAA